MADSPLPRAIRQCPCPQCQNRLLADVASDHAAINRVVASLDERRRRWFAGLLALRHGRGGIVAVARITGLSRTTIRRGIGELQAGVGCADDRVRRPGGGRPALEKKRPRS
jgi:hypothetical protein